MFPTPRACSRSCSGCFGFPIVLHLAILSRSLTWVLILAAKLGKCLQSARKKPTLLPAFPVRISIKLPCNRNLLHDHTACSFYADEVDTCFVLTEVICEFVAAGVAIIHCLPKQIIDADML